METNKQADQTTMETTPARRASKRLAGLKADPPLEMKKPRAKRSAGKMPVDDAAVSGSKVQEPGEESAPITTTEVGERSYPIPAAELLEIPEFEFAYSVLTDAIPLPGYLQDAPPQPPAQ